MKTSDEIKKGLACCAEATAGACDHCPYVINCEDFEACMLLRDAIAYINQLEARVPKWISVKDRLPEPHTDVLLIAQGSKERSVYIGRMEKVGFHNSWLTGITNKASDCEPWIFTYLMEPFVTHWMPIPEMPN